MENPEQTLILRSKRIGKPTLRLLEAAAACIELKASRKRRRNTVESVSRESSSSSISPPNHKRDKVTSTRLVNRIWERYTSKEDVTPSRKKKGSKSKNGRKGSERTNTKKNSLDNRRMPYHPSRRGRPSCKKDIRWSGDPTGITCSGNVLYEGVLINRILVSVGCTVLVRKPHSNLDCSVCFVEYMFQTSDGRKVIHGRRMLGGFETVLGNTANPRELCLTNDCIDFDPYDVIELLVVKIKPVQWRHQHRKGNEDTVRADGKRAVERKTKGLPTEYFCRNLYLSEEGAFRSLKTDLMGVGNGDCHSCNVRNSCKKNDFTLSGSMRSFTYQGTQYSINDFLYLSPQHLMDNQEGKETDKKDRDQKPKAYVICQLLALEGSDSSEQPSPGSVNIKVRRFYRPEDISPNNAYISDIREVYYSTKIETVPLTAVEGRCEVVKKADFEFRDFPCIYEHKFFCGYLYDLEDESLELLPSDFVLRPSEGCLEHEDTSKKATKEQMDAKLKPLATLDIFSGCGGLSEGLEKSGVSVSKWAIESEKMAAQAFKQNHPNASMVAHDCNVVLREIMTANGDADDCIPTSSTSKLDEEVISSLPQPGVVDFIVAGPPCQGFSVLNRFNKNSTSNARRTMILSLLSFVDYYRPRFLLIENVRNLVSFDEMKPFQLTLASLLEMGYQVRFGVLEAGLYGVAQSRRRVFIWGASPEELLPEWPEPMHAFSGSELRMKLDLEGNSHYTAVSSTKSGAPFRALTVRDTIGDLPALSNGDTATTMEYKDEPQSWFQNRVRGNLTEVKDHVPKKLSELNLIQCKYLEAGADWRNLPIKKVMLSNGKYVDLKPNWLVKLQKKGIQSKGVLGRLEWEKHFPTAITNPQPRGKVGRWFHPDQNRMISLREYARSQGFPDWYEFAGSIKDKYQQVGNAVPPPLAFSLGRKLKETLEDNA